MGASQSQQSQPTHNNTASSPSPTHTAAHQTFNITADSAHSAIDTVAATTEQAKQKLHEAEHETKRRAEDIKRTLQQREQQVEAKAEQITQRATSVKDELKHKAQQTAEEVRQRLREKLEPKEKDEWEQRSVWQRVKDNIQQRYEMQYRCPAMEEVQQAYNGELRFRPLPMHRLVVKSPNLLADYRGWNDMHPLLQLVTVSTQERGDMMMGHLTYGDVKGGMVVEPYSTAADWLKPLYGEVLVDVPTESWRDTSLYADELCTTGNIRWRSRNSVCRGEYHTLTHMYSPLAAFTFGWDYRKQFHSVTTSLSSTLYHDPLTASTVTAGVSAKSEPFNNTTLAAGKPAADVLSALVHYSQPQYTADVQAAYHRASGQLHSYAARALFRSSPLGSHPHCKVGIMLSDRAVLDVRSVRRFDAMPPWEEEGGSVDAGCYEQPVLSSCVVYSPSADVDWKCHVASSGHMGVMMQTQLAAKIGVEVSVVRNVITNNKAAVGVGVTLG